MRELNCLGDFCPVPLMKLTRLLSLQEGESVKLITDHSCVCESVTEYCKKIGLPLSVVEPINGVWEMFVNVPGEMRP